MRFCVVETGYDQGQVDSCLDEIGIRLARLAARAEGAARAGREWDEIRDEATALRGLLQRLDLGDADRTRRAGEAADLLTRARVELDAAREEARQVRERVYAEAVQARREFEEALHARRRREERVDRILDGLTTETVPADTPTAAAAVPGGGVPATRIGARGGADAASDPPGGRAGIR
ncbi:ATPase [Micromonospora sp. NPDC049051]|uniref:ATPase n=1 Tax=unclassified Micromonospora TaxID=2617518 RepID=UPI003713B3A1